jgi:hypothetical protein
MTRRRVQSFAPLLACGFAVFFFSGCGSSDDDDNKSPGDDMVSRLFPGAGGGIREVQQSGKAGKGQSPAPSQGATTQRAATQGVATPGNVAGPATGPGAPFIPPQRQTGSTSQSSGAAAVPVALSRAVMLPQTLPGGTQATFSVEYRFTSGGPQSGREYSWIISAADGAQAIVPVTLESTGTLQLLDSGFDPSAGPFRCWLVEKAKEGEATAISGTVMFRS